LECSGTVHQLFINSNKAYILVRTKVLYNILTEIVYPWNWLD